MKIHLHASVFFENWNYDNEETGIGGSETHQIEMAWRLARRGYEVFSYAPIPEGSRIDWRGTTWRHIEETDFSEPGIWAMYRNPVLLDCFEGRSDQRIWFVSQDEHYGRSMTPERAAKLEKFIAFSPWHAAIIAGVYPFLKDKIVLSSNGIKCDLIRELEKEGVPERNPNKCIFTSSPDRGVESAIAILRRAREWVPELELHIYYGLDNIEKLIAKDEKFRFYKVMRERILKAAKAKNVTFHGRISQRELYREIFSAGIWLYPTEFGETSCINCMEAQAMGAVPVTNPYAALASNVDHGIIIKGWPYHDQLTQCRYVGELVKLAQNPALQEAIRDEMMPDARARFNWERMADQWSNWIDGMPAEYHSQFQFQARHMRGRVLNIGCGNDPMNFAGRGVINLDISEKGPVGNIVNKPHIIHDARNPIPVGNFDSIILGDILEHLSEEDAIKVLLNAKQALGNGGPIIITCPDDSGRPHQKQHREARGDEVYAEGVSAFHDRSITRADLTRMIEQAGLKPTLWQDLDYNEFIGNGVVCHADSK